MERIELMELKDDYVRYKYFPENSEKFGIVAMNRNTGERKLEKTAEDYGTNYAAHAFRRIDEFQKKGEFLHEDMIAWY